MAISDTDFLNNTTENNGGGLFLQVIADVFYQAELTDVDIHDNHADSGFGGGVFWSFDDGVEAAGSYGRGAVYANTAVNGGGILVEAGENADLDLRYITVSGNTATALAMVGDGDGGGLHLSAGIDAVIVIGHCTIADNSADGVGGGMFADGPTAIAFDVGHTILADNAASDGVDCAAAGSTVYTTQEDNVIMDACFSSAVCPGFGAFSFPVNRGRQRRQRRTRRGPDGVHDSVGPE